MTYSSASPEEIHDALEEIRTLVRHTMIDPVMMALARAQLDQLVMGFRAEGASDLFVGAACFMALVASGITPEISMVVIAALEGVQ